MPHGTWRELGANEEEMKVADNRLTEEHEYRVARSRAYDAALQQLSDPNDPAGHVARMLVDRLWPVVEELERDDGEDVFVKPERAGERFAVAIQEFVNDNVGVYQWVRKEEK